MTPGDVKAEIPAVLRSQMGNLFECEPAGERVQISTPFLMPDGHQVDLYWRETPRGQVVSDLGDTYGWLFVNGAYDELTSEQDAAYETACVAYDLERSGVALLARVTEGELADAVIRLGQAVTMVSHTLDVGQQTTASAAEKPADLTANRIAQVIQQHRGHGWRYQRKVKMAGQHGRDWQLDFMVHTPKRRAALIALYARKYPGHQRRAIANAFTVFSDLAPTLSEHPTPVSPISVIDDNDVDWYREPIGLLSRVSKVVWLSSPDSLAAAIAG